MNRSMKNLENEIVYMSDVINNWEGTSHNPIISAKEKNGIIDPDSFSLISDIYDQGENEIRIDFDSFCNWWDTDPEEDISFKYKDWLFFVSEIESNFNKFPEDYQ